MFDGIGQAAVAVDPVFLQGVDGFGGVGFGEFAVGMDAQLGVGEVGGWDEGWEVIGRLIDD